MINKLKYLLLILTILLICLMAVIIGYKFLNHEEQFKCYTVDSYSGADPPGYERDRRWHLAVYQTKEECNQHNRPAIGGGEVTRWATSTPEK